MPKQIKESNCDNGFTSFYFSNIPCDLMNWFRGYSYNVQRRDMGQQLIILIEKCKKEHEETEK